MFRRCFLALFAACLLVGCERTVSQKTDFCLDTVCTIRLYDHGRDEIYDAVFKRLGEINNEMASQGTGSELDRVNAAAGVRPVKVKPALFFVVSEALRFAALSDGAFDPSIGPLVKLWNINGDHPRVPSQAEIDKARALVNWRDVVMDKADSSIFLRRVGMALDLGGIAKGYAADECARVIRGSGVKRGIIDLGGNIFCLGSRPDGTDWKVGVQNPLAKDGAYMGVIKVTNKTLVTSGVYERFFVQDGKRYHHLLSPFTGWPADNGLLSVSIVTDKSIDADALSTSVFVLGYEKGAELVRKLGNIEAVFVFTDKTVRVVGGNDFELTDPSFYG